MSKKIKKVTYEDRKRVIEALYKIRKVVPNLPKIKVRLFSDIIKQPALKKSDRKIIFISKTTLTANYLYQVIAREIAYVVYNIDSDNKCLLMSAKIKRHLSAKEVNSLLTNHIKNAA